MFIAQLVKLSDYVSRYEMDIYKYPSRYVRLKKERWERIYDAWEKQKNGYGNKINLNLNFSDGLKMKKGWKLWPFQQKQSESHQEEKKDLNQTELSGKSLEQLKFDFGKELFSFQLNWASATIAEVSDVQRKYHYDQLLFSLVRELPDTFFIFYEPILVHKKAPIDFEIMILTPSELWLIKPLAGDSETIYYPGSDRFWTRSKGEKNEKILHPAVSLKRMRTVIEPIFTERELSIPIKTVILAKDAYIDNTTKQRINLIDKRNYSEWKGKLVRNIAPIKLHQMKLAEVLLAHCMTVARERTTYIEHDLEIDTEEDR